VVEAARVTRDEDVGMRTPRRRELMVRAPPAAFDSSTTATATWPTSYPRLTPAVEGCRDCALGQIRSAPPG
jgi:hypothetical protein